MDEPQAPGSDPGAVQARLDVAEETLRAIRNGEVDALVVKDESPAAQVFTLSSADRPYRKFVENMRDGAATVSGEGIVLYANRRLAELLARPLRQIIGSRIGSFVAGQQRPSLRGISGVAGGTIELELLSGRGVLVPVRVNASPLDVGSQALLCFTFADLTEQRTQQLEIDRLGVAQTKRMAELESAQAALTLQATHDTLTELPNRGLMLDRVAQALALAERLKTLTGLVFIDLDSFKGINDTHGHAAGDMVLQEVAVRLKGSIRPMDSVARLGGDEFVVLLPALGSPADAVSVAQRIAASLEPPIRLEHGATALTASVGISLSDPTGQQTCSPESLFQRADTAMYHAKSRGGSRTELFAAGSTPSHHESDREAWPGRIHDALEEDRFVLFAQPIVDLATRVAIQHELLLRLRDRDGGIVPPLAFLPTAERCGLITEIDKWVIAQAAAIAAADRPVSVNLSAASVGDETVFEQIEHEVSKNGTRPGDLVFEITETAVMQNVERGRKFAERLTALGCQFALDDFGTGFASFTYLKRLPVGYLKIDIEFVRDLLTNPRDRSVVSAIVALASGFDQHTIAEGVEDEETARVLRELGVTYAQGYFFGRPAPLASSPSAPRLVVAT